MASMKEIREHIASIQSTQKVTNAMYLIASTKMRRAKEDLAKTRPFFDAVSTQIEQIFQHAGEIGRERVAVELGGIGVAHQAAGG